MNNNPSETKQHVSKSKLSEELVKKGWNVFTSGFSQNNANEQVNPFVKGKETIITKPEWDHEVLRKQILTEGDKSKKRKPVIELKAEFISHRAKSFCTFAHEKSFQQHAIKEKCHPLKKCTNPVFLEVQNIQNSFHQNESGNLAKPAIKFSSNSCGDFNSENGPKRNKGQENVQKKGNPSQIPITLPSDKFLSSMSVQKVKKINFCGIQSLEMNDNSLIKPDTHDKKTTDVKLLTINTESRMKKEVEGFKDFKFHLTAVNVVDMKKPNVHSLKPFTLDEEESSGNKGSSWVQSLVHIDNEGTSYEDPIGKKKIRNIIPRYECPKCGKNMVMRERKGTIDGMNGDAVRKERIRMMELKSIGVKNENCNSEEDISLGVFKQRVHFKNDRYEVELPWKRDSDELNDKFNLEKKQL
ncbi:uncharacterized protein TNCV_1667392 [Trichonephila clavipes]|nr:uncharacterized protein TNCV_1667392 [Trichonephila clavipes]